ncbi:MAG: hypothetical protein Q6354_04075 [Candidatus Brocadiales bacterium]|nr:hypothetical protein [Candidatus Brocadiales bacterium]
MRQLIMVVLVLFLIGGCASYPPPSAAEAELNAWFAREWAKLTPEQQRALEAMASGEVAAEALAAMPPPVNYSAMVPPIEPIQVPLPATTSGYIGHDQVFLQTYKGIPGYTGDHTVGRIGNDNVYIQHPR